MRLVGVNRSGSEYACVAGDALFDGPVDDDALDAIASWGTNVVRLPLNEHCWLGAEAAPVTNIEHTGSIYREAIVDLTQRLIEADQYVILDLHWSGPGATTADGLTPMPNADYSELFWIDVATTFAETEGVLFDVFNEPFDVTFECWRDGCELDVGWRSVGSQQLVSAIRSTGARQPILVAGVDYAHDLRSWLEFAPVDPANNIVASFHGYDFNRCDTVECWESELAPVADQVPLILGEVGQSGCARDHVDELLAWADQRQLSALGWTWNVVDCNNGPALIADFDGTPTAHGLGLFDWLAGLR